MADTWSRPGILVVDDDPGLAQTMSDMLEARGYRVEIAATGQEALAAARTAAAGSESRVPGVETLASLPDVPLAGINGDTISGLHNRPSWACQGYLLWP